MFDYNIENDEIVDVLNNAGVTGVMSVVEEYKGFIRVYINGRYCHEDDAIIEDLCCAYGYDYSCNMVKHDEEIQFEIDADADAFDLNPIIDI